MISIDGGAQARWRPDGTELFYIDLDNQLIAVPIRFSSNGQSVELGAPATLFQTQVGDAWQGVTGPQYMVSPDSQRFLMDTVVEEPVTSPITILLNWKANR